MGQLETTLKILLVIDAEVKKIIGEAHRQALDIITENRVQLDTIANHLIDQETLTQEEIENIAAGLPIDHVAEVAVDFESEEI